MLTHHKFLVRLIFFFWLPSPSLGSSARLRQDRIHFPAAASKRPPPPLILSPEFLPANVKVRFVDGGGGATAEELRRYMHRHFYGRAVVPAAALALHRRAPDAVEQELGES